MDKKSPDNNQQEIKTIIDLLAEYSTKLHSLAEQLNDQRRRMNRVFYISTSIVFLVFIIWISVSNISTNDLPEYTVSAIKNMPYYALGAIGICLLFLLQSYGFEKRRLDLIAGNIKISVQKLEELVRKAYAIEEHTEVPTNIALELDLKLTDAEGALQIAKNINR